MRISDWSSDVCSSDLADKTVHSVAHGVIRLEELSLDYGPERRRMRVIKYRGRHFRGGFHDFVIERGGVRVFPRLVSAEHKTDFQRDVLKSESTELDALLGGGIERGSRSEEHTSELQSLIRISYAVFRLK